jgi:FAD/FMN-containing dehydrogenase
MAAAVGLARDAPGEKSYHLLARFAGNEAAVEYQLARAAELVAEHAKGARVSGGADDEDVWARLAGRTSGGVEARGTVWRAGVPPAALGALLARLTKASEQAGALRWQAGAGDGRLRVYEGAPPEGRTADEHDRLAARSLGEMREAARAAGGSLVVERSGAGLRRGFDAWGLSDSSALLMRRVKEQLDPSNIFSPGRCGFTMPSQT